MENGQSLEWVQANTYQPKNLKWCASYTQNTTSINFIKYVLVPIKNKKMD